MFYLLLLAGALIVAVLLAVPIWTFRTIAVRGLPAWWGRLAAIALLLGAVCGFTSGCVVTWQVSDGERYVGFPIPAVLLLKEHGRWVDYEGFLTLMAPYLDALLVATVFILPVSLVLLFRRRHRASAAQDAAGRSAEGRGAVE